MNTSRSPRELAINLCYRSKCRIKMAAVITDKNDRIFAWGWNSNGNGSGMHAEQHAIERANRKRLAGSKITIAGIRSKNQKFVCSRPCVNCLTKIISNKISAIEFLKKDREWENIKI